MDAESCAEKLRGSPSLQTLLHPIAQLDQGIPQLHLPLRTALVEIPCLGASAEAGKTRSGSLPTNALAIPLIHPAAEDSFLTIDH